jgi:hypothetical protein
MNMHIFRKDLTTLQRPDWTTSKGRKLNHQQSQSVRISRRTNSRNSPKAMKLVSQRSAWRLTLVARNLSSKKPLHPALSKQQNFINHHNTIKMAPNKEYALLCLENPLLGMYIPLISTEA